MTSAPTSTAGGSARCAPTRDEFRELAVGHRVIPVSRRLLADDETPVGVYRKLAGGRPGTFLLESAENGAVVVALVVRRGAQRRHADRARRAGDWTGDVARRGCRPPATRWRRCARRRASCTREPLPGLPPLTGGLVGYLGYDAVRRLERLPELAADDLRLPELVMMLATDLAALDHHEGTVTLIANAINWDASDERVDEAYDDAVARLDRMTAELAAPAPVDGGGLPTRREPRFTRRRTPARAPRGRRGGQGGDPRRRGVPDRGRPAVRDRRDADPLDVYRVLRATNPSPYMYLLRLDAPATGSTSSAPARRRWSRCTTGGRPRTRSPAPGWRGATAEEDAAAGEGPARRPEGARRAPHARRPRPQRPGPGLRARHASRCPTSSRSSATATSCTSCPP